MEVCFEILVPNIETGMASGVRELIATWGDEECSFDPKKFLYGENVFLTQKNLPRHIKKLIPNVINISNWVYLSFDSESLLSWENAINGVNNSECKNVPIKEFLHKFLKCYEKWVVVFELNCDQIDGIYNMSYDDLVCQIEKSLNWENEPEGFVALYHL